MAVGRVLIAVTNVYNRYSAEKLYAVSDESKFVYQCCTTCNQNLCFLRVIVGSVSTPP